MLKKMAALLVDEEGQGMVEYGLIIALISVALIAVLGPLKDRVAAMFNGATAATSTTG